VARPQVVLVRPGIDGALRVAHELGLPVHPVDRVHKRPLVTGWPTNATTDEDTVVQWWTRWPDANIGVPTGKRTGRLVVDVDPRHGGSLATLDLHHGLPDTVRVATGGGGWHLHFARPDVAKLGNGAGQLPPGIDIRCDRGQVVVPESVHATGRAYEWLRHPNDAPLAPLPGSLLQLLLSSSPLFERSGGTREGSYVGGTSVAATATRGGRNVALTSLAGKLLWAGVSMEAIEATLLWQARTCGLPAREVDKLMGQVATWARPPLWVTSPLTFANDRRLRASARMVLLALVDHANPDGRCYPGVRRLADMTGLAPNTVTATIGWLEECGRIEVKRARSAGRRDVNRYRLLPYEGAAS
jgi:putative DNA primase/helicase